MHVGQHIMIMHLLEPRRRSFLLVSYLLWRLTECLSSISVCFYKVLCQVDLLASQNHLLSFDHDHDEKLACGQKTGDFIGLPVYEVSRLINLGKLFGFNKIVFNKIVCSDTDACTNCRACWHLQESTGLVECLALERAEIVVIGYLKFLFKKSSTVTRYGVLLSRLSRHNCIC